LKAAVTQHHLSVGSVAQQLPGAVSAQLLRAIQEALMVAKEASTPEEPAVSLDDAE
jgi:hypothetical protein